MPNRHAALLRHVLAAAVLTAVVAGCGGGGVTPTGDIGSPAAATNPAEAARASASGAIASTATSTSAAIQSPTQGGPTMQPSTPAPTPTHGPFTLTSTAFDDGGRIPRGATCDGADRSPALAWTGAPDGAKALVLFLDDPDAHDFVHWTVLDMPVDPTGAGSLPAGVHADAANFQQGRNDFRRVGYGGPCPPSGTHHYRFRLYALAAPLGLDGHPTGDQVRAALGRADIVGRATLSGTYRR